jgi:hypothetical protein
MPPTAVVPQSSFSRCPRPRRRWALRLIFCATLVGAAWLDGVVRSLPVVAQPRLLNANLIDLLPGQDYVAWYQIHTGYAPNAAFFGAYTLKPDGATLYLGYGSSRPAAEDGALLASYDACAGLRGLASLNEQGFIDLHIAGGKVYVPGTDPCCGDKESDTGQSGPYDHEWDWGNAYVFTPPDALVKHRNLPNTLHTWGMWWVDVAGGILYAATGGHMGDWPPPDQHDEHWTGRVFASSNDGDDWTLLADLDAGVGDYRTYDIIGFADRLYVNWSDRVEAPPGSQRYVETCGLAFSSDGGQSWTRLPNHPANCARRLAIVRGQLATQQAGRRGLVLLAANGAVSTVDFPAFRANLYTYQYVAEDGADRVYVLTEDGRIMRAANADLSDWVTLVSDDRAFVAITYWPDQDLIVVSDRGENGRLWALAPAAAAPLTLPPTPAVAIGRSGANVALAMGASGDYRVYRSTSPYFLADQYNRIGVVTAGATFTDSGKIGDATQNYFYLVRAENSHGLSLFSNRVGEFDFALVPGTP